MPGRKNRPAAGRSGVAVSAGPFNFTSRAATIGRVNTPPTVVLEFDGPVAVLRLNRPQVRNALSRELIHELDRHVAALENDPRAAAVILTGNGPAFCAGADLGELASADSAAAMHEELRSVAVFDRLAALPMPVIAAVHGYAVGGGFLMTLYCDLRIVARGTKLGLPKAAQQWLPPWALSRLAAWIGPARAEQMLLTAGLFDVAQADRWGLVDQVVEEAELLTAAKARAVQLSTARREVVREVREFFRQFRGRDHAHWDRVSAQGFARLFGSPEAQAAIRQFLAGKP